MGMTYADIKGAPDREGRAMVLFHGAGGNRLIWDGVTEILSVAGVPAVALDLPGHGDSPIPITPDVGGIVSAVTERLSGAGITRIAVVGHSLGGAVALTIAARKSIEVIGLGVVSSGARLPVSDALLDGLMGNFGSTVAKITRAAFSKTAAQDTISSVEKMMAAAGPALLHSDFSACAGYGMTNPELMGITCPVAIICGEEDKLTPMALSEELAASLKGSVLTRLPAVGHMSMLESPRGTAGALIDLWERISTS